MQYNQPNQQPIFYIRPKTPKLKNNWLTILLKVLLIGGILFSVIIDNFTSYNSLFFYIINASTNDYLAGAMGSSVLDMAQMMGAGVMSITYKVIAPILLTLVFFGIYFVYAKFFAYLVFNQFLVIGQKFDIKKFRISLDTSFIFLTIGLGISKLIFMYYPLAYNIGYVIVNALLAVMALAIFFLCFSRGLEKKYYPILLYIMTIPSVTLILFI